MAFDEPSSTLFVANNRHDGPRVDLFHLDLATLQARHIRSIAHPLIHGPNAITIRNSHELFLTNDHHFLMKNGRLLSQVETYLGLSLGTVVHVDISDPQTTKANKVARVAFANGIEIINDTTLAVASTSKTKVNLYTIVDGPTPNSSPSLVYRSSIKTPFNVDNLSRTSDGRLLLAGHPHVPSLTKYAATRWICNDPAELAKADAPTQEYCETAQCGSWVSEWTETGGLKHLYADTQYPSSATAAYDPEYKVGIIAGLYGKGILVWRG
jgi:arylesterase / paraoxonase